MFIYKLYKYSVPTFASPDLHYRYSLAQILTHRICQRFTQKLTSSVPSLADWRRDPGRAVGGLGRWSIHIHHWGIDSLGLSQNWMMGICWHRKPRKNVIGPRWRFSRLNQSTAGWWFGTMEFYFCHHIGNVIIPTDFHSIIFQRGWLNHGPILYSPRTCFQQEIHGGTLQQNPNNPSGVTICYHNTCPLVRCRMSTWVFWVFFLGQLKKFKAVISDLNSSLLIYAKYAGIF